MAQLFSNKIKTTPKAAAPKNKPTPAVSVDKVDIAKYKDPEGLSLSKMKIGLWFVENRQYFIYVLYGALIFIALLTWPRFLYVYGQYIIKGMRDDANLLRNLSAYDPSAHDYVLMQSPKNILVGEPQAIKLSDAKDLVVKIQNPNTNYWAEFEYYFQIGSQEYGRARSFILPGDTKYLMALNQQITDDYTSASVFITDIAWKKIDKHQYPDWEKFKKEHLDIIVSDKNYKQAQSTILTEKMNLNELDFKLNNNTAYSFYNISVEIVLFSGPSITGVNRYVLEKFLSGETRSVDVTWPGNIGHITDIVIIPEINAMDSKSYMGTDR